MTATKEASSLTPKQTEVMDLLKRGRSIPQVAKAMKISESGVYGHLRRIREAGHVVEAVAATNGKASESAATNGGEERRPALNGSGSVDVPTMIRSEIERANLAMLDIEEEATRMTERAEALRTQKEQLQATVDRHKKALDAYAVPKS